MRKAFEILEHLLYLSQIVLKIKYCRLECLDYGKWMN